MDLWLLALMVVLFNLPFGYWRANVGRLTLQWFLAIHLPVPFVVAGRIYGGIGWELATFPVLIAAYAAGQLAGARLFAWCRSRSTGRVTSCLIMDALRKASVLLAVLR